MTQLKYPSRRRATIYIDGIPCWPTPKDFATRDSLESPFIGCPVFIISKGEKYWCQNGTDANHEGTHCG
jgi:hypothetical protein